MNRTLWRAARLLLGLILLLLLIPIFAAPEFWETLRMVNLALVALALGLSVGSVASKAWRWGVVMHWRGIRLPMRYLLFSYFISMFFSHFLPSGMGGDVVRAYETARDTGRGTESVIGVVIERGSGMLAVFAAGSLGALVSPVPPGVAMLAHGLLAGTLIALWALWLDATGALLRRIRLPNRLVGIWTMLIRIHDEFRRYRREWRLLAAVMGQSLVTLALTLASVYTLLLAFGQVGVPFAAFAAFFSIATAIDAVPFSLNSLGVREGTYVFFLGLLGVSGAAALGVALLVRLLVLIQAAIGGAAFVWRSARALPDHAP